MAPATPHLHPLPHPHCGRRHRGPAGMALPLVSQGAPRPPSSRGLPAPTPQRGWPEHGSPPNPPRPPRTQPPAPGPAALYPPHSSPANGDAGGDGTRGGVGLPPAHLPPVQQRFRPANRNTLTYQQTPLPSKAPLSHPADAPRGLGVLSGQSPNRPQRSGPTRLGQVPPDMPQREASHAHQRPFTPTGTGRATCPRRPPGQQDQNGPRGPPARLPTGRGARAGTGAKPHSISPLPSPRTTPLATPSPTPTATAVPRHPHPAPTPTGAHHTRTAALTNPSRTLAAGCAGPGNMASPAAPARPRHFKTPAFRCPYTTATPTSSIIITPSTAWVHRLPSPRGAPYHAVNQRHTYHHHQPLPVYQTVPWSQTQPAHPHHHHHTAAHHLPARPTRCHNVRAAIHPHSPTRGHARAPTTTSPAQTTPSLPSNPSAAASACKHRPPTAAHRRQTAVQPGVPGSHLPSQRHGQPGAS